LPSSRQIRLEHRHVRLACRPKNFGLPPAARP
jgi:hypothetical protein